MAELRRSYLKEIPSITILRTRVNAIEIPDIIQYIQNLISKKQCHNYIVVANVDTIITSKFNALMQEAVNNSSLAIPDGFPLLIMQRLFGNSLKKRAYGPDLMRQFLQATENYGYSHFFYGATENTLNKLTNNIVTLFPKTKISGSYAPPFRPLTKEEDNKIIEMINNIAPDVLWIGIGCPKQELWMFNHREKLNIPVMVGVGAAFDFMAGTKRQAPAWIRDRGFEWLFRLITEPKRLWRRYLINNFLFIYYIGLELFSKVFSSRRIKPN